jgi:hypothetical protein
VEIEVSVVGRMEVNVVDSVMVVDTGTVKAIDVVETLFLTLYFVFVFGELLMVLVEVRKSEEVTVGAVLIDTETSVRVVDLVQ